MKSQLFIILFMFLLFSACTSAPTVMPLPALTATMMPLPTATATVIATSTHAPTATDTYTSTPLPTMTRTPVPPSPTPRTLSVKDVDLPIKGVVGFEYKPCYVFTTDRFHAGDAIYMPDPAGSYKIYAPMEGTIVFAQLLDDSIGWEINVMTPFMLNGEAVYYLSTLMDWLKESELAHSYKKENK
jgi:hypothetical protein